jgi:hypothetical protein
VKKEKVGGNSLSLFIYFVLVVLILLDFGSLFLVLIPHLNMLAADLLAGYRQRLYKRCRLVVS